MDKLLWFMFVKLYALFKTDVSFNLFKYIWHTNYICIKKTICLKIKLLIIKLGVGVSINSHEIQYFKRYFCIKLYW